MTILPTVVVQDQRNDRYEEKSSHRSEEEHEHAMVVKANTVINPWTVMVKAFDTPVANAAVAGAICADNLTVGAEKNRVEDLHHL